MGGPSASPDHKMPHAISAGKPGREILRAAKGGYVRYHPYAHNAVPLSTLKRHSVCDKCHTEDGAPSSK